MRPSGRPWRRNDVIGLFGPLPRRPNPWAIPWRWRWELGLGLGIPTGLNALAEATHPSAAIALAITATVGGMRWAPARRFLVDHARGVVVQHRLRAAMAELGIHAWSGRWLPAILWTTPTQRGIRLLLWCHAGVGVSTFLAHREALASDCWAADIEVIRHPRWANVVVLLVVTRPDGPRGGS